MRFREVGREVERNLSNVGMLQKETRSDATTKIIPETGMTYEDATRFWNSFWSALGEVPNDISGDDRIDKALEEVRNLPDEIF